MYERRSVKKNYGDWNRNFSDELCVFMRDLILVGKLPTRLTYSGRDWGFGQGLCPWSGEVHKVLMLAI